MAHHGNHRHSHISRLIKAGQHRHQMEAREGQTKANDENGPDSLANSDPIRKPSLPVLDALAGESETCDPLQNVTCLEDIADVTIWKRESTETDHQVVIETVVEVVDAQHHTLWQSTGTDLPMTISDPSFGTITISPGPSSTAESSAVDGVAALLSSQPRTSHSLISPTRSSTPVAGAGSSAPAISTPLIGSATTASATKSTPLAHNNFLSPISASNSLSSETHSSHTSSSTSTTTGFFGGSGNTGASTGSGSGTSPNDSSSGGSGSINPTTSKIVGGVVGTVAGIAMIILLLFYYLRRRGFFRNKTPARLGSHDETAGTREMARNDDSLFAASYFAPAFMNRWRNSAQTTQTDSTLSSNPSERGFQKISGRKIQSVLTSGGDGYGGSPPEDSPTLPPGLFSTTSPRASPSHAPPPANPFSSPLDSNYTRETEEPGAGVLRPSPARNPVPGSANIAMSTPIAAQPQNVATPMAPPAAHRPDGLGRSFPSFDGSRGSRFQESLDL